MKHFIKSTIRNGLSLLTILMLFSYATPLIASAFGSENTPVTQFESVIEKVNDDFYVGKIEGKDLRIVMERVTDKNIEDWKYYVWMQKSLFRVYDLSTSGLGMFERVLLETSYKLNEIFVAYITAHPNPLPSDNKFIDYPPYSYRDDGYRVVSTAEKTAATQMKTLMTVISSPNALVISHMGISHTAENFVLGGERGIAMDLHSFAAKVMLLRNPGRRLMINAPTPNMCKIIAQAIPEGVFISTKELIEKRKKYNAALEEYKRSLDNGERQDEKAKLEENFAEIEARAQKDLITYNERLMKEPLSDIDKDIKFRFNTIHLPLITLKLIDEQFVISLELIAIQKKYNLYKSFQRVNSQFKTINLHYLERQFTSEHFEEFLAQRPPIISVDPSNFVKMVIYDTKDVDTPWLTIEKSSPDYNWVFTGPLKNLFDCEYAAIDLQALASYGRLEPVLRT